MSGDLNATRSGYPVYDTTGHEEARACADHVIGLFPRAGVQKGHVTAHCPNMDGGLCLSLGTVVAEVHSPPQMKCHIDK